MTNGCKKKKKNPRDSQKRRASQPAAVSVMSGFKQQLFTRSDTSSVSLSVRHLVCNAVSSFAMHSVSLTVSRSSSMPVTRSVNQSSVCQLLRRSSKADPPINYRRSSISRCDIQKKGGRHQKGRANSSAITVCFGTRHRNRRYQVADGHGTANKKLAVARLIDRVINRQTVSQSHQNTHTQVSTVP